tara:strand:- start:159 stop:518 length:360 start_codon:yes stop_codon:yes gene_type:complete
MANELTLQSAMSFTSGIFSADKALSKQITVAGTDYVSATQSIGTSEEELAKGEITGSILGYLLIYNTDATNYVEVASVTTKYAVRLLAGEFALFRPNGSSVFCKANTGACIVEYLLLEA